MVNEWMKRGVLTPEEARTHQRRNVLTAAMGAETSTIAGDFAETPMALRAGDTLLMCSDGLHGLVEDDELALIASEPGLTTACQQLIAMAKQRGGGDNITVQLLRVRSLPA